MRFYKKLFFIGFLALMFGSPIISCQEGSQFVRTTVVKDRAALVGGPMALGKVGDYLLENSQLRAIISKHGISNAFGMFGGNLIDADRIRGAVGQGNSQGGKGFDSLVEMFPIFFLAAVDSNASQILCDGVSECKQYEGKPAVIRVSGTGASFIGLTEQINDILLFMDGTNRLNFDMDYVLRPEKNYIELNVTMRNNEDTKYNYRTFGAVPSVAGMVGLFGKRNSVFIPGVAGFNLRFGLEHVFGGDVKLNPPAIPGLIGDFVGSRGKNGVSYGLVAELSDQNYVFANKDEFAKIDGKAPINQGSLLVPLEGSSITAAFTKTAPTVLAAKGQGLDSFSYKIYIVIGDGSVSSIRDAQLEIHKRPKGLVSGQVFEEETQQPIKDARVIAYKRNAPGESPGKRVFYTEFIADARGRFRGYMEPGEYLLVASHDRIVSKEEKKITVQKDGKHFEKLMLARAGRVLFTVRDKSGNLIPAKVTALAKVGDFEGGKCVGKHPIYCLYDPHLGIHDASTDFRVGLTCADGTRCNSAALCKGKKGADGAPDEKCSYRLSKDTEFREDFHVSADGRGELKLRPLGPGKKYKIVASRGIEYELDAKEIELRAGEIKSVELRLVHSVPTPKMISADLHVHTNLSHDSAISDTNRVASFAAEGVDYFVTTDHNRVRDIKPVVEALKLERWLKTGVGLELTTFDMGHFNAFPLKLDINSFNGGNPNWFRMDTGKNDRYTSKVAFPEGDRERPLTGLRIGIVPTQLFDSLRKIGKISPEQTIIQINHPRDSIFGYFNTYNISPDTSLPVYASGLTQPNSRLYDIDKYEQKFDAIEIFNGKRLDLIWHWRIPPGLSAPSGYGGGPNTIIRLEDKGAAKVAAPGGGNDWFNMLNHGKTYTATANSDTHDLELEAGTPRNYFLTGFDDPQKMTDQLLVDMIRQRKVLMTNGPVVYLKASDKETGPFNTDIGGTLKSSSGDVYFDLRILAASWIDVTEVIVYKNGRVVKRIPVPPGKETERLKQTLKFSNEKDAWFVFVVKGEKDMWPVFRAEELEPFQIGQAVSLIQETLLSNLPLSLSFSESACLLPAINQGTRPYAITNPIWIDKDGDGKYTADPCSTLGEKGIRCYSKTASCKLGLCLDSSLQCKEDKDCPTLSRCTEGKCIVDSCKGMTCAPAFQSCTEKKPCANDVCPAGSKTCEDGTPCKDDTACSGKGDGFCRYCACPAARKACKGSGSPCLVDADCGDKGTCETGRYCQPTACALGHCLPTYPVCAEDKITKHNHLFLTSQNSSTATKTFDPKQSPYQKVGKVDKYTINQAKAFFMYFNHRH